MYLRTCKCIFWVHFHLSTSVQDVNTSDWQTGSTMFCWEEPAHYFNGSPNEYVNASDLGSKAKRHRNYLSILSAPPQPTSPLQVLQRDSVSVKQPDENQQGQQGGLLMMLACVTSTRSHVLWRYGQVREGGAVWSGDNKKRINRYEHAARGKHKSSRWGRRRWNVDKVINTRANTIPILTLSRGKISLTNLLICKVAAHFFRWRIAPSRKQNQEI